MGFDTPAEQIIEGNYDGVMLSNGPGDPEENTGIINEIKKLCDYDRKEKNSCQRWKNR